MDLTKSQMKTIGIVALCGAVVAAASVYCSQSKLDVKRVERLSAAAYEAHPDDAAAAARASADVVQREFKSSTSDGSARKMAAAVFVGFYAKNFYAIPDVCAENGVQLTSYPMHFAENNAAALQVAERYVDVPALMSDMRRDLTAARKELERVASNEKADIRHVCNSLQERGADIAANSTFQRWLPEIYATLMNGA